MFALCNREIDLLAVLISATISVPKQSSSSGCVDHVFTLRLIIEKSLRFQTPLVLSFIDYEQAFDSVDRTALTKSYRYMVYQKNTLK